MPQMAPINWITLYMLFSMLFIMSCILNYYMFMYTPTNKTIQVNKTLLNWKW
uniref:ATP synthase complex subunit 8 n=1 Tax=Scolytinae sp. BMNH 1274290 TaxID=2558038 RepID=A0A126TE02_9CUCU|nr:ATP synthase F0 subunit 8 [Scolytinae sp. BMNH 1274290]